MNEKSAIYALRQVKKVLDENNVKFWLDCGTLLGAVRDGKIIPWDCDIDLGVWIDDYSKIVKACQCLPDDFDYYRIDSNLKVKWKKLVLEKIIAEVGVCYKDYQINISLYSLNDNNAERIIGKHGSLTVLRSIIKNTLRNNIESAGRNMKVYRLLPIKLKNLILKFSIIVYLKIGYSKISFSVPKRFFEDLSTIEFYGMEFKTPSPVEEYLEFRYGEDWKTPKQNYIYYKDDQSIIKND